MEAHQIQGSNGLPSFTASKRRDERGEMSTRTLKQHEMIPQSHPRQLSFELYQRNEVLQRTRPPGWPAESRRAFHTA